VEECQTAAEFLLEPWILVQLPFQPLLLHQWSVALLAEALKFQKELGEFQSMPKQLQRPVGKLVEMCQLMFKMAFQFFDHFSIYMYEGKTTMDGNVGLEFLKHVPDVLPVIKFVLSNECKTIVKVLTKMASSFPFTDHSGKHAQIESGADFSFCYNQNYWKQKSLVHILCSRDFRAPCPVKHPQVKDFGVKSDLSDVTASELEGLKKLIEEKFISTGKLKGRSKEFILGMLQGQFLGKLIPLYRWYLLTSG